MGRLSRALLAVPLLWAAPAAADPLDRWSPHIAEASSRFEIPAEWIRRVIRAESGGRTMLGGKPITSPAGAMGLMQLMPGTWADLRAGLGLGPNPHDPRGNIIAGTAYLRAMYDRFGYPGLFGAYHAGPARYAEHLRGGRPLPGETRAYVAAIGRATREPPVIAGGRSPGTLLVALRPVATAPMERGGHPPAGLFVELRDRQ